MRTKLAGFLAAVALVVVGGYFVSQDVNGQRQVLMTVAFSELPAEAYAQVNYWVNAEPNPGNIRPNASPWVERVTVVPGTPVLLRAGRDSRGTLTCLIQVIGGDQDRDHTPHGLGRVECKVYA